jgi:hypothetical protein
MNDLIDRFADGEFTADDIVELGAKLSLDADARLRFDAAMAAQRSADDALVRAASAGLAETARIMPSRLAAAAPKRPPQLALRVRQVGAIAGWAAAILLAAIIVLQPGAPSDHLDAAPDTLLTRYMTEGAAQGRVVGELPQLTLKVSPAEGGDGYDVLFVRRLLERATVEDVYRLGLDEHGRPAVVQGGSPGADRESL